MYLCIRRGLKCSDPCHSCERTTWHSRLLTLAWPIPGDVVRLGSEPADGIYLSSLSYPLSFWISASQISKQTVKDKLFVLWISNGDMEYEDFIDDSLKFCLESSDS